MRNRSFRGFFFEKLQFERLKSSSVYKTIHAHYFYRGHFQPAFSLLQVRNYDRMYNIRNACAHLTRKQKILFGVKAGFTSFFLNSLPYILIMELLLFSFIEKSEKPYYSKKSRTFSAVVIDAPIIEEIIFRGITQNLLELMSDPITALLFTSLIFAAAHFANGDKTEFSHTVDACIQVSNIFLFPTLCVVYFATRSLPASIAAHMVNNGMIFGISSVLTSKDRSHQIKFQWANAICKQIKIFFPLFSM